jgi:hypothetical protein
MVWTRRFPHTDPDVPGDMPILIVEDNHEMRRTIRAIVAGLAQRIEARIRVGGHAPWGHANPGRRALMKFAIAHRGELE